MLDDNIIRHSVERLAAKKPLRFQINGLTKVGRKHLRDLLDGFFEQEGLDRSHVLRIHYAIVEVVFNALKANVKFVAFREEIRNQLSRFGVQEIDDMLQVIVEERTLREFMAARVLPEVLRKQVRQIFELEDRYRAGLKDKLTAEQIELIKKFRHLVRKVDAEVNMLIAATAETITIEVSNNVPILQRDLDRIEHSRRHHGDLYKQGRANEFFSYENLDTTESAGFGIAMVDQGFYKLGLDPFEQLHIKSDKRETRVTLVYPRVVLESP
jgi:hypothetical protein